MKILYLATSGAVDPTRASLPLHIAANGSVAEGQDCAVALVGDGTELVVARERGTHRGRRHSAAARAAAEAHRQPRSDLCLKGLRRRPWGDRHRPGVARRELAHPARARSDDRGVRPRRERLARRTSWGQVLLAQTSPLNREDCSNARPDPTIPRRARRLAATLAAVATGVASAVLVAGWLRGRINGGLSLACRRCARCFRDCPCKTVCQRLTRACPLPAWPTTGREASRRGTAPASVS